MSRLTRRDFEEINIELCTTGRISTAAAHEVIAHARAADEALGKIQGRADNIDGDVAAEIFRIARAARLTP